MDQVLLSNGPVIAQLWPSYCPVMAQVLLSYGPVITQLLLIFGPEIAPSRRAPNTIDENEKLANWGLGKGAYFEKGEVDTGSLQVRGSVTDEATPATLLAFFLLLLFGVFLRNGPFTAINHQKWKLLLSVLHLLTQPKLFTLAGAGGPV